MLAAYAGLTGLLLLELWYISGQEFGTFCLWLILVGEAIFLTSLLLGDYSVMVLAVRRPSDWVVALVFPAVVVLGMAGCLAFVYQLAALPAPGPCGEICMP